MSDEEERLGNEIDAAHAEYLRVEHASFLNGGQDSFLDETTEWGSVKVEASDTVIVGDARYEIVRCSANAGGWEWQAEDQDRLRASIRLWNRMRQYYPFEGLDWGPPGYQTGRLSKKIPAHIRKRMIAYQLCVDPNMVTVPDDIDIDIGEWLEAAVPDEWL